MPKKNYPNYLQQDQADCGVACLLSIIQFYKGNNNIETLRRLSGTYNTGTTLLGLYQAANAIGFNAQGCEANIDTLIHHNQPCILHLQLQNQFLHYVVCWGFNIKNNTFIISDPAQANIQYYTIKQLQAVWISNTLLILEPNEHFITQNKIIKQKKQWILNLIKTDYPLLGVAGVIGIGIAILSTTMALFSQRLIDYILPNKNITKLISSLILVFILLICKEGFVILRQYFLIKQGQQFNNRIINYFFSHLLSIPKSFFDTRQIGDLTARLNDTSRIQRVISLIASNVMIDILMVFVCIVFIFYYNIFIGLFSLLFLPILFFVIYKKNPIIIKHQQQIMQHYASTESNYIASLRGIESIKNHNKQNMFIQQNKNIYSQYQDKIFELSTTQIKLNFWINSLSLFFLIGVLSYGCFLVLNNTFKIGSLMALLSMCTTIIPSVVNLALLVIPINEAKIAFNRMFEFTSIKPEDNGGLNTINIFNSFEMKNVSFRYAGQTLLLQKIQFKINKGEIVTIQGENGSGKSSLIQIIQKYYIHESGDIIINDVIPLTQVSIDSWHTILGVVPQNSYIFNGNVLYNIGFDDATLNPQKIIDFLEEHLFIQFIQQLPNSYNTLVGEAGINLSGGQKQLIALARVLYHQPQLLILDEATANMSNQMEEFVIQVLLKLKPTMGIIFISHKNEIILPYCSKNYFLQNGKIVEHLINT